MIPRRGAAIGYPIGPAKRRGRTGLTFHTKSAVLRVVQVVFLPASTSAPSVAQ
jgi:hypothetical protein